MSPGNILDTSIIPFHQLKYKNGNKNCRLISLITKACAVKFSEIAGKSIVSQTFASH